MPFSTLFERLRMIEEIRRAAAALRAKFNRHSDIDLKPYEDFDASLRRRIDGEGVRVG
jgi:hypothetical protein